MRVIKGFFATNKCCRYSQNGMPMTPQAVQSSNQASKNFQQLKEFLKGWSLQNNHTTLQKIYYIQNYLLAIQFIKNIAKIDALSFQNKPSFCNSYLLELKAGQILKLNLFSPPLKGLSQFDFFLAVKINEIKLQQYQLIELKQQQNYRQEILRFRIQQQDNKLKQFSQTSNK